MQTSESFRLSACLAFSGGLQDAYTFFVRDGVFANAQTGNVVRMSENLLTGHWHQVFHYLAPLFFFAFGVFCAERIEHRYKEAGRIHWRQIILACEILILGLVGFMPAGLNMLGNILVSFCCAMQVQTFKTVHGYGYASTMCIGNLRSATESFSVYLREKDAAALQKAMHFFGIILVFAIGSGIGGVAAAWMGIRTIWISSTVLFFAMIMMRRETIDRGKMAV